MFSHFILIAIIAYKCESNTGFLSFFYMEHRQSYVFVPNLFAYIFLPLLPWRVVAAVVCGWRSFIIIYIMENIIRTPFRHYLPFLLQPLIFG